MLLTLLLAAATLSPARADHHKPGEYDVKAAYLYNFGQYVSWENAKPVSSDSFTMCVLGADPFGDALDSTARGGSINGKLVAVKRITDPAKLQGCRIVFVSTSESGRLAKVLTAIDGSPTLTVSDIPHFCDAGGMIQFVPSGSNIRFEVNLTAARDSGLALSSELLKLATRVIGTPGGRNL